MYSNWHKSGKNDKTKNVVIHKWISFGLKIIMNNFCKFFVILFINFPEFSDNFFQMETTGHSRPSGSFVTQVDHLFRQAASANKP